MLGLTRDRRQLGEVIAETIRRLDIQGKRLLLLHNRLKAREELLFKSVVSALENGERERAYICANEASEIRKIRNSIWRCCLMVEQAIIRLDTMRSLGHVVSELRPALSLVKQLGDKLADVMPDVSSELGNVSTVLDEVLQSTSLPKSDVHVTSSKEGEEILREVTSKIKDGLRGRAPLAPRESTHDACDLSIDKLLEESKKPLKVVLYDVSEEAEERVLRYVVEHGGEVNFRQCAEECDLSLDELQQVLESLSRKGKIALERRGALMA